MLEENWADRVDANNTLSEDLGDLQIQGDPTAVWSGILLDLTTSDNESPSVLLNTSAAGTMSLSKAEIFFVNSYYIWECDTRLSCVRRRDSETEDKLDELRKGIGILRQLTLAFRTSPRGKVLGPDGVAEKLGLSKNGVYYKISLLELTSANFVQPGITLPGLFLKSALFPLAQYLVGQDSSTPTSELD